MDPRLPLLLLFLTAPLAGCLDGDRDADAADDAPAPAWPGSRTTSECTQPEAHCPTLWLNFMAQSLEPALDGSGRLVVAGLNGTPSPVLVNSPLTRTEVRWTDADGDWHRRSLPDVPTDLNVLRQRAYAATAVIGPDGDLHAAWLMEVYPRLVGGDTNIPEESRYLVGYARGGTGGGAWDEVVALADGSDNGVPTLGWLDGPFVAWGQDDVLHLASPGDGAWRAEELDLPCGDPHLTAAGTAWLLSCGRDGSVQAWRLERQDGWNARRLIRQGCDAGHAVFDGTDAWFVASGCGDGGTVEVHHLGDGNATRVVEDLVERAPPLQGVAAVRVLAAQRDAGGSWHLVLARFGDMMAGTPSAPPVHLVLDPDWTFQAAFDLSDDVADAQPEPSYLLWAGADLHVVGETVHLYQSARGEVRRTDLYEARVEVLPQ